MPTPLPSPADTNLNPPEPDEVLFISRGLSSAACHGESLTELQEHTFSAVTAAMTGHTVDFHDLEVLTADEFAEGLAKRNAQFRTRMVQYMEMGHMILPTPSVEVADRVIAFAEALNVDSECVYRAREVAVGSRQLISADFDRSAYLADLDLSAFTPLKSHDDKIYAWTSTVDRPELADRWRSLSDLGHGTLGRGVHDFYIARGFRFPGEPGSAPPLLAQHDWVHVLADYGSVVASELEVFAFIARASDNPQAFTLLAMVINLFQTGAVDSAAGIFQADPGHLARGGMPVRLADALRRGALCTGSTDFLAVDFWSLADQPIDDVRQHFGIVPKSDEAVAAGSPNPWSAGGISEFQIGTGRELAAAMGLSYDTYGATV